MKCLLAAALVATSALAARLESGQNPIRRIVNLLQKMQDDVTQEGKTEKELYDKFMCYCKSNGSNLDGEMSANAAEIERLTAEIKAKTGRAGQLDSELKQHKADRAAAQQALAEATQIREKEHGEFTKENGDANDNINALGKAISALEKGMGKSFLQAQPMAANIIKKALFKSSGIADVERQTVMSFLDAKQSPYGDYAPASGEIVGILKQLKDEMEKDLGQVLDDERSAQKAYDELAAAKKDEIAAATTSIESKSVALGETRVEIANAKGDLKNEQKELSTSQQLQANLKKECKEKTADFEARSATRNEELLALSDAIKYLNSDDALELFKKTLSLSQAAQTGTVFLQKAKNNRRTQGYAILEATSSVSASKGPQIALIANMLKAGAVDFSKVITMIDNMIDVLNKEQTDDENQKRFAEKTINEQEDAAKALERTDKGEEATINDLEAQIDTLKAEIETLNANIKTLDKETAEATEQRKDENKEAQKSQADLTLTIDLLKHVKNRLNKFYNPDQYIPPPEEELNDADRIAQNSGETLSTTMAPEFFAGSGLSRATDDREQAEDAKGYKKSGKSSGVLGLMDMAIADAERQLAESKHDEESSQKGYEKLMADSQASRAEMTKSLVAKESELATNEGSLSEAKVSNHATNEELNGVKQYLASVHAENDWLLANFDERKEARQTEIEGLKKAKAVLSGADYQ